jgi:hypothetical protein
LYANITWHVNRTNETLTAAFDFARISPYEVINVLTGAPRDRLTEIRTAIISMSLAVATLLLMVDFFKKTINFEWSSKWENVLLFLIKIIVVKQVVQNSDVIMGYMFAGFSTITDVAIATNSGMIELLPFGDVQTYTISRVTWDSFWTSIGTFWNPFTTQTNVSEQFSYIISEEAVRIFYPGAPPFPAAGAIEVDSFAAPTTSSAFNTTLELILLQPYFLAMQAIGIIVFVITIGRVFELALYTIFAPLPLCTFASDVTSDVGKSFIKNYIAAVLQIVVIVVMFLVFAAMQQYYAAAGEGLEWTQSTLIRFVILIAFGMSVIKSGSWARKV